jgi:hypothetical protein
VGGRFQTVERCVASSAERGAARRASEGLDRLGLAMLAIANESMNMSIGDAAVEALLVRTGEAFGVYALGSSPTAFHLTSRTHWRRRCSSTQRGSGTETTGGTIVWAAGFQQTVERTAPGPSSWGGRPKMEPVKTPKQRQREQETEHEQMKGHTKPRCLKWRERRIP